MTCRTRLDAGNGRRRHAHSFRPDLGSARSVPAQHSWPGAADLVKRVAAIVPTPGDALCADDSAWEAFSAFLDEAARSLTGILGPAGIGPLRALLHSPLAEDAVTGLLIERALTRLQDADH